MKHIQAKHSYTKKLIFFKTWLLAPDTRKVHRDVGLCSSTESLHKEVSEVHSLFQTVSKVKQAGGLPAASLPDEMF